MENSTEVPQKLKNRTTVWSNNSILGIYPKEIKSLSQYEICARIVTAALFTMAKAWKQLKYLSVDEWIQEMYYLYTMNYYSIMKKKGNPAI